MAERDYPWKAWFDSNARMAYERKPARISQTIAEKLHERLLAAGYECDIPERQYHGHAQRNCGAWSWMAKLVSGGHVGSQFSMKDCLSEDLDKVVEVR